MSRIYKAQRRTCVEILEEARKLMEAGAKDIYSWIKIDQWSDHGHKVNMLTRMQLSELIEIDRLIEHVKLTPKGYVVASDYYEEIHNKSFTSVMISTYMRRDCHNRGI